MLVCIFASQSVLALADGAGMSRGGVGGTLTSSSRNIPGQTSPALSWHDDLQSGWEASKSTGRPMLIFITSESCVYCDAMKDQTICNDRILRRLADRFVAIRLRPKVNGRVLSRIKVPAYPTTLVAAPEGKVIAHKVGYQPVDALAQLLESADRRGG
ncbi:MAG: thioredoxin family protein [Planctomycetota bacterium]